MKIQTLVSVILIHTLSVGCSSNTENVNFLETTRSVEQSITETDTQVAPDVSTGIRAEERVGNDLFNAILDTITIDELSIPILTESNWTYKPFPNCISTLTFAIDETGIEYNCEIGEEYSLHYSVNQDTLYVTEYHVPHVDNPEGETRRLRDDKYVLNNNSLTLVGSTMYNNAQRSYVPQIAVVIQYDRD